MSMLEGDAFLCLGFKAMNPLKNSSGGNGGNSIEVNGIVPVYSSSE